MNCTNCQRDCNQGRDCDGSTQATRAVLGSGWFWIGGALSLLFWSFLWALWVA